MEPEVERVSDLRAVGDILAPGKYGHSWPPAELAPGVTLQRRSHVKRNPQTQEPVEVATYLEPVVLDPAAYYANLTRHNRAREADPTDSERREIENTCPTCNGATVVRHGELTPGRPGFGALMRCPRWRADAKRCVWLDAMGFEVTR